EAFLKYVTIPMHRAILMLCYGARLSISEVVSLKVSDIDTRRMRIRVRPCDGGEERYADLNERMLTILREYRKIRRPTDWLFPAIKKGKHIQASVIRQVCREACRMAGFSKSVTAYVLRRSVAAHVRKTGTGVRAMKALLGRGPSGATLCIINRPG